MRERLDPFEKANLRGAPKTAAQAFAMFERLCQRQKVTPVFVRKTLRGCVYKIKEIPTFKACFRIANPPVKGGV